MLKFEVRQELCTQCGLCARDCPVNIIDLQTGYPRIEADKEHTCIRCQHCLAICPTAALSILGRNPNQGRPVKGHLPDPEQMEILIKGRRSVRHYADENLDSSLIQRVLDVAWQAPTGVNMRQVRFSVIDDKDNLAVFRDAAYAGLEELIARGQLPEDKAFFAGGMTSDHNTSDIVDIYDASTGMWSTKNLSFPRAFLGGGGGNSNAATVCGKAYFVNGGKFDPTNSFWEERYSIIDIFDPSDGPNGTWTTEYLPYQNHRVNHTVVAIEYDTTLMIGGGGPCGNSVDIYKPNVCVPVPTRNLNLKSDYTIFPNPAREKLNINVSFKNKTSGHLALFDTSGHKVYQYGFNDDLFSHQIDLASFTPGVYLLEIRTDNERMVEKVMVLE